MVLVAAWDLIGLHGIHHHRVVRTLVLWVAIFLTPLALASWLVVDSDQPYWPSRGPVFVVNLLAFGAWILFENLGGWKGYDD